MVTHFDKIIDRRGSAAEKWDACMIYLGADGVLPMWVADMDFAVAEPIAAAIAKRAAIRFSVIQW